MDLQEQFGEIDFGNMSAEFMRKAGMVRASFGLYSTMEDVDLLVKALKDIIQNHTTYAREYIINSENDYENTTYSLEHSDIFNIVKAVDEYLS